MRKEEIKKDPIRDSLINGLQYLSENTYILWGVLIVLSAIIVSTTYFSNKNNSEMASDNEVIGLTLIDKIFNETDDDSLKLSEFNIILDNSKTKEGYNIAFIYILNHLYKNNEFENIKELLTNNNFNSSDNMMNSYINKVKAEILYPNNIDKAISLTIKAINQAETYTLKVSYCQDLIDLYISNKMLIEAISYFDQFKLDLGGKNLPIDIQNNIDYIDYKLKQLDKNK